MQRSRWSTKTIHDKQDLVSNTVHHYALMSCLAIALDNDYDIIQIDISSAYVYAPLQEELYICSPLHLNLVSKVFKLEKSLYGLKQAGANWYSKNNKLLIRKMRYELYIWLVMCVSFNYRKVSSNSIPLCWWYDYDDE